MYWYLEPPWLFYCSQFYNIEWRSGTSTLSASVQVSIWPKLTQFPVGKVAQWKNSNCVEVHCCALYIKHGDVLNIMQWNFSNVGAYKTKRLPLMFSLIPKEGILGTTHVCQCCTSQSLSTCIPDCQSSLSVGVECHFRETWKPPWKKVIISIKICGARNLIIVLHNDEG